MTVSSALMDELAIGLADCYPTKPPSRPSPGPHHPVTNRPTIRAPEGETLPPVAFPRERAPARIDRV